MKGEIYMEKREKGMADLYVGSAHEGVKEFKQLEAVEKNNGESVTYTSRCSQFLTIFCC